MGPTTTLLRWARARIEKPDRWTQSTGARLANGSPCLYSDKNAARYCVGGALWSLAPTDGSHPRYDRIEQEAELFLTVAASALADKEMDIFEFNDAPSRQHAEILALYDIAIAISEEAECLRMGSKARLRDFGTREKRRATLRGD